MNIIEITQDLMRFRSETGNIEQTTQLMTYIKNIMTLIGAKVDIFAPKGVAPVIFIRNKATLNFDTLVLGHVDVVPASEKMFSPLIKEGKLYGRGSLDMKSFAAVALNSMQYVIENKLPLNFGIILSSDEEKGSKGTHAFLKKYATKYEKHIKYEDKDSISGMDYIAIKFLVGLAFVLFNILTFMFQVLEISLAIIFITFFIGFFLPDIFIQIEYQKKRRRIEDDLLKAIIIMNNSFKSGRNIMQAVEIVKNELDGPISDEFKKIYLDMTYGLSIEVVFDRFYNRVKLDDAKYITSSLTLLNRTGGNIVKVFGTIERSFFDKKKLKQEMQSLTSASIFVFRILCFLPLVFILAIYILNPDYFAPIFMTGLGRMILVLIILLYALYILVIKKVLKVKF